jgi:hypothetical protein
MLTEDHPTIRYVSPRGWIKKTDYLQQNFRETLSGLNDEAGEGAWQMDSESPGGTSRIIRSSNAV